MTAICLNVRRRTAFDLLDDTNGPRRMPVRNGGPDSCLSVDEGLVEVTGDRIPILTEMAVAAGNINAAKTEEAHSVLTLDCVRDLGIRSSLCKRGFGTFAGPYSESSGEAAVGLTCRVQAAGGGGSACFQSACSMLPDGGAA